MSTIQRLTNITVAMVIAVLIMRAIETQTGGPELKIRSPEFKCKTASAAELRARCLALGKNDEYARFMALVYRSGKTRKEIAGELCISEGTVKKYKHDRTIEMERPL